MIRKLFKSDIEHILAIENAVHIAPWNREVFQSCFSIGYPGWALELDGQLIGFIIVSILADECHILNVCVAVKHQRNGFGRQMLEHVINFASQQGVQIFYLEVRRSNTRAIALYKKMHFHLIGERKDYYPTVNGREDALIFALHLKQPYTP